MLINAQTSFILLPLLSCLASAYSTLFLTEGMGEEGKTTMVEGTKIQKMEKNDAAKNQGMEVEVIPIVTDIFTQSEDLLNMTPLKLVSAISAQHLITTVNNIPVAGNSYKDSLDMLEGIINEVNKTAQIIKLTAKYVNISGHYILSILKEFTEQSCEMKSLDEDMKFVRKNFLKTIADHAVGAIKELNEKTRQREMTGSDILVSSSYHIVSAFQEMTNQVLSLAAESKKKCQTQSLNFGITPISNKKQFPEQKSHLPLLNFHPIPQQGKIHKSIKKDQAQPKTEEKTGQTTFNVFEDQSFQRLNDDDLTVEVFSGNADLNSNKAQIPIRKAKYDQLKVPEVMTEEYIPLKEMSTKSKNKILTEPIKGLSQKSPTIKMFNPPVETLENFNNQDLTVELFPPRKILKAQSSNKNGVANKIKLPTEVKVNYIPINKMTLFAPKERFYNQKASTKTKFGNSPDPTENLNNQDLRVKVFSPYPTNSKNVQLSSHLKSDVNPVPNDPPRGYPSQNKLSLLNLKNGRLSEIPKESQTKLKMSTLSRNNDRELDSSLVDSLSLVEPWLSTESKTYNDDPLLKATTEKVPSRVNLFSLLQNPYQNQMKKQNQCDDHLEPICCYDVKSKKFIVFLNECKRGVHNRSYQTNYSPVKMDMCVELFLRDPKLFAQPFGSPKMPIRNVDLRPR